MRDRYASLREGLVGAWIPSVSGSGLLLPDLSGNGNNGALTNMGPEDWVSSQYGRALDFDGSNDYVSCDASRFASLSDGTVSLWIKTTNDTAKVALSFQLATSTSSVFTLYTGNGVTGSIVNEIVTLAIVNSGTQFIGAYATSDRSELVDGNWHHLALSCGNSYRLFLDGEEKPITTGYANTGEFLTRAGTVEKLYIAARLNPSANIPFNGQLDDIRIYNRALSESEIKLLASRPGIGLKPQRRTMYYAPPTGARRRRILTSMP